MRAAKEAATLQQGVRLKNRHAFSVLYLKTELPAAGASDTRNPIHAPIPFGS